MPKFNTPGVYTEEISSNPASVLPVETSIPVFIGYTEKHVDTLGNDLNLVPTKINSIADYTELFGTAPVQPFNISFHQKKDATGKIIKSEVSLVGNQTVLPETFLYYTMQLYFANGGGQCYVISIGTWTGISDKSKFIDALRVLDNHEEPSIIVFPDVCKSSEEHYGDITDAALFHCKNKGNRVVIADVLNAYIGETEKNSDISARFRDKIVSDVRYLRYGAAYFPYLKTTIPFVSEDESIIIMEHKITLVDSNGAESTISGPYLGLKLSDNLIKVQDLPSYNEMRSFIINWGVTIPPSGAVAGAIVRNDTDRGVWKAPANISLSNVQAPTIKISNKFQDQLNVDKATGKSVNAIRDFSARGSLIWGARTLAGNDNEWRYIPVVRFCLFVEKSVTQALEQFVFEANEINTWNKVKTMIENFLMQCWRSGAMLGQKSEEAYFVKIGLGDTMTFNDIQNGDLKVLIGLAVTRPSEFIVVKVNLRIQKA